MMDIPNVEGYLNEVLKNDTILYILFYTFICGVAFKYNSCLRLVPRRFQQIKMSNTSVTIVIFNIFAGSVSIYFS